MAVATEREYGLFIDGAFAESAGGEVRELSEPATGAPLARAAMAGEADVDRAVGAARAALDGPWGKTPGNERSRLLHALADALLANRKELAELESRNVGKAISSVKGELHSAADTFRFYASALGSIGGRAHPVGGSLLFYSLKEPVGVCAQIVPWNYPLMMAAWKLAPALAAGCAVVLKPDPQTPLSVLRVAELAAEVGFPAGRQRTPTGPPRRDRRHPERRAHRPTSGRRTAAARPTAGRSARRRARTGSPTPTRRRDPPPAPRDSGGGQRERARSRRLPLHGAGDTAAPKLRAATRRPGRRGLADRPPPPEARARAARRRARPAARRRPRARTSNGRGGQQQGRQNRAGGRHRETADAADANAPLRRGDRGPTTRPAARPPARQRRAHNMPYTAFPGIPFGGFKQSGFGRELSLETLDLYLETKSVVTYTGTRPTNPFGL